MLESSSWRELLKTIITNNPSERERLANEIGVNPVSISRWVSGESAPRPRNLAQLLRAIPRQYQDQFRGFIEKDDPALARPALEPPDDEIEYDFITEVLNTRATTPSTLHFWGISRLIIQHALRQLDSERIGMAITVVRCMPPREGIIYSLRESVGMGTPPWEGDLEQKAMLLGAESLAGHVVATCHPEAVQDLSATSLLPAYQTEHEVSAMASPILYANRIAGCLLFSSTQKDYFTLPSRLALIAGYTRLVALAFEPKEFYPPEIIELRMMPSLEVQRKYFAIFRQRVHSLMVESFATREPLTTVEAEHLVWQRLEEEMIRYSSSPNYNFDDLK